MKTFDEFKERPIKNIELASTENEPIAPTRGEKAAGLALMALGAGATIAGWTVPVAQFGLVGGPMLIAAGAGLYKYGDHGLGSARHGDNSQGGNSKGEAKRDKPDPAALALLIP